MIYLFTYINNSGCKKYGMEPITYYYYYDINEKEFYYIVNNNFYRVISNGSGIFINNIQELIINNEKIYYITDLPLINKEFLEEFLFEIIIKKI
jgi:hypothetical protein